MHIKNVKHTNAEQETWHTSCNWWFSNHSKVANPDRRTKKIFFCEWTPAKFINFLGNDKKKVNKIRKKKAYRIKLNGLLVKDLNKLKSLFFHALPLMINRIGKHIAIGKDEMQSYGDNELISMASHFLLWKHISCTTLITKQNNSHLF